MYVCMYHIVEKLVEEMFDKIKFGKWIEVILLLIKYVLPTFPPAKPSHYAVSENLVIF